MYTEEEIDLIVLSSFSELSYASKKALLSDFSSRTPDFAKCEDLLIKTLSDGVYNKVKGLFYDADYRRETLASYERKGIVCVTLASDSYPETLKNIPEPPVALFCKGDATLLKNRCFSVVGSRKTSPKTLAVCKRISGELAQRFTVVTGIAEGADSAAIHGALPCGKVISVLACGFDHLYPSGNAQLAERVGKEGLLVTEYTPETKAKRYHFPVRNRIIAGLSEGTLVISAGEKSGALITANLAADYGRDVFAFPHSIGESDGAGCNFLIKSGASLVENILDIFQVYGLDFKIPAARPMTEAECAVYEAIRSAGEAFLPVIAKSLGKLPHQLIPLISSLEIQGKIVSLGGNRYAAI